jgi:hypothetical protein
MALAALRAPNARSSCCCFDRGPPLANYEWMPAPAEANGAELDLAGE